jgi:hypothetical protein
MTLLLWRAAWSVRSGLARASRRLVQNIKDSRFTVLAGIMEGLKDILFRKIVLHAFEGFRCRVLDGVRSSDGCDLRFLDPLFIVESGTTTCRDD